MKRTLTFSILSIFAFLAFCGIFLFSLPTTLKTSAANDSQANATVISTATELGDFINHYSSAQANANIVLGGDIDMSSVTLTNTIGTAENAFSGAFDGNGYTISNLKFDFTASETTPAYIGLFGVTSGATIYDLEISGVTEVRVATSPDILDIGNLVGSAENFTTIQNVSINSSLNYIENSTGVKTINAGGFAGELKNSTIKNSFYRPSVSSSFSLTSIFKRDARFGGIAGAITNSSVIFVVSAPNFSINTSEGFIGTTYVGGVFGTISQGNSKVINCVVEPTINITNNAQSTVYSGAIGGHVTLPAPYANNMSYVYYYSTLDAFGDSTNYNANNNITKVNDTISTHVGPNGSLIGGARDYFDSKSWSGLYGDYWDFDNTFVILDNNISLQAFQDEFNVRVTTSSVSLDESIVILLNSSSGDAVSEIETNGRYNDSLSISFKFNSNLNNLIGSYYSLTNLDLTSGGVTKTVASFNAVDGEYRLINVDGYERISMETSEENSETIYTITINGITNNYTGNYQLNVTANKFVGLFEYRLFDKEDVLVEELAKLECYVYNKSGGTQTSPSYTITDVTYNNSYTIATNANVRSIYEFKGWYLENESGEDILLSTPDTGTDTFSNSDLSFTFGQGNFALTNNFVVYAKYVDNSCSLTFGFDEGIERIIISTNADAITETGTSIKIRKQSNVKMEVFLKDNYTFDVNRFLELTNSFKGVCTRVDDGSNPRYYQFELDMTQLSDPSFNDILNLTLETEVEDTTDWTLIWIIVGSCLGGLVLIAVIIIVIVVVKRRGGGRGGKMGKSSYKNMYY